MKGIEIFEHIKNGQILPEQILINRMHEHQTDYNSDYFVAHSLHFWIVNESYIWVEKSSYHQRKIH
jgi:hypothetical protein